MAVDPVALGMTEYRDTYDDLGEMAVWVDDLGAAWAAELEARRVVVAERDAGYVHDTIQAAPRDIVWSFMTDPALRPRWQADVQAIDELPTAPRRGVGTTNHCMHGTEVLVEEILDWRPTDHVTHRTTLPNGFKAVSTFAFEDVPEGRGPDPLHLGQEPPRAGGASLRPRLHRRPRRARPGEPARRAGRGDGSPGGADVRRSTGARRARVARPELLEPVSR